MARFLGAASAIVEVDRIDFFWWAPAGPVGEPGSSSGPSTSDELAADAGPVVIVTRFETRPKKGRMR